MRECPESAGGCGGTVYHYAGCARGAHGERIEHVPTREALQAEVGRLQSIIRWMLGEQGDFPARPDATPDKPYPYYWWRTALRVRAHLPENT